MAKVIEQRSRVVTEADELFRVVIPNKNANTVAPLIIKKLKANGFAGEPKERVKTASALVLVY